MKIDIKPQEGKQTKFLKSKADIAIYGGASGGGKTYALLLEPLYHYYNKDFGAVIFRRNATQVRNEGGLWDESLGLYSLIDGKAREAFLEWTFPTGMSIKFAHLEHKDTVYNWQGSQIAMIGFDELTHFDEKQFWYMLSRNRSMSGVSGYVRATCNPDADSWVRKLIDWWIDKDGFAIEERSGVLRWFVRISEELIWGDSKKELTDIYGVDCMPKSLTFIPSKVYDNKILMEKDPAYLANLKALNRVERMRLLDGNWNIRPSAGNFFKKEWFQIIETLPSGWVASCRFWDRAATKPNENNKDPDWTRGLKMYKYSDGSYVVADIKSLRDTPHNVEILIKNTALQDGYSVDIYGEQEAGSSGVAEANNFVKLLSGFNVRTLKPTKDKETRAKPVSAQSEAGNIKILRGIWNDEFLNELENFPEGKHDDQVDTFSGAFNELNEKYTPEIVDIGVGWKKSIKNI